MLQGGDGLVKAGLRFVHQSSRLDVPQLGGSCLAPQEHLVYIGARVTDGGGLEGAGKLHGGVQLACLAVPHIQLVSLSQRKEMPSQQQQRDDVGLASSEGGGLDKPRKKDFRISSEINDLRGGENTPAWPS